MDGDDRPTLRHPHGGLCMHGNPAKVSDESFTKEQPPLYTNGYKSDQFNDDDDSAVRAPNDPDEQCNLFRAVLDGRSAQASRPKRARIQFLSIFAHVAHI